MLATFAGSSRKFWEGRVVNQCQFLFVCLLVCLFVCFFFFALRGLSTIHSSGKNCVECWGRGRPILFSVRWEPNDTLIAEGGGAVTTPMTPESALLGTFLLSGKCAQWPPSCLAEQEPAAACVEEMGNGTQTYMCIPFVCKL